MTKPGYTGIKRIRKAAGYSSQGIRSAWQHESAFRQECAVAAVLLSTAPVFSLFIDRWIYKTPLRLAAVTGTLTAVAGVAVLTSG